MNQEAPLMNEIKVVEGNIRMYLMLIIMLLLWGSIEAWRLSQEDLNPVKVEEKKTPEVQLQGVYINN